ncbi:heterokaryon incompatibility protein-domain-containing protein [Hypoxylon crocopeplum]|nr:heterokaryon incompatibility protein-domain-containing protein [Hypoxylon crocopeplum]
MPCSTVLCSTCRNILCPQVNVEPSKWMSAAEQTFEDFQKAAEQGSWSQVSPQAWTPLRFQSRRAEGEENIIKVWILYHDPIKENVADLRFRLISSDDGEYKRYFQFPHAEPSTSSAATLTAAYNWFEDCRSSHPHCNHPAVSESDWHPTRLVHIGHQDDTHWRLRVVSEDGIYPETALYMTLSYRWPPNPKLTLLTSNIAELRRENLIEGLPQLFRDLIVVARRFSVRYIWIDAFCIIQDSRGDWEVEAAMMRSVYANSACNIAASASSNPDEGLFRSRDPKMIQPGLVPCSLFSEEEKPHYIFEKDYWNREILQGPLHRRGWVFQERFLAPRVLYFGKSQVLWECLTEHKCEGFPEGIPAHYSEKNMDPLWDRLSQNDSAKKEKMDIFIFNLWIDLVNNYSLCDLTKPSDKLAAIAGIAQFFGDVTGVEYVAGLWKSKLIEMLDWHVYAPRALQSTEYRAPSWSWASVDGPIRLEGMSARTSFLIELLDVQVRARGLNSMINILEATITLKANISVATCHYLENGGRILLTEAGQFSTYLYIDTLNVKLTEGQKIVCMPYKKDHMNGLDGMYTYIIYLILEELASSNRHPLYRRLGHFRLEKSEEIRLLSMEAKSVDITII